MFHSARLKLTAWYLLIIMALSIMFSVAIYQGLSNEVERFERMQRFRIERRLQEGTLFPGDTLPRRTPATIPITNPELLEETKHRILLMLVAINCGIFALSGGLGYILAGRTLMPIKDMMDDQNRFISDASHELRTPLTSLKSAFEVYLRSSRPSVKEAKTLVRESISEVNKLQSLSESLLQLAQYQKPNGYLVFEKVSLRHVIEQAIHKIQPLAKEKEIAVHYDEADNEIEGNVYGLVDLVVILLDNAVKYSPRSKNVVIKTEKTDGSILLWVKDNGCGISEKDVLYIFDRFYRADSARSKSGTNGYGLGLSIAKKIVDAHNGSISVESKPNKGATFLVKLPINH